MKPKNESYMSHETRLAVIETNITNINSTLIDIKNYFHRIDKRFDHLEEKFDKKIDALEERLNNKIDAVDIKLTERMEHLEERFERSETKTEHKFESIQNRLWFNLIWEVGMFIGIAGLIARAHHWI